MALKLAGIDVIIIKKYKMWSSDIFLTQNDEQISSLEQWGVYLNVKVALFLCHFGIRLLNKLKHVNKTQIKKID